MIVRVRRFLAEGWNEHGTHLLHHFIAAVMLASMMQALETRHLLEWLDGAMLRVSAGASGSGSPESDPGKRYRPGIVDITPDAFSAVFQERRPLDRDRLHELLEAISRRHPEILAVDIDVSPAIYERDAPRAMDQLLKRLVQSGMQIALVLPDPSDANVNLEWIRARCADGVHFASPLITERMGAVTRIDINTPSLAAIALQLASRPRIAPTAGPAHASPNLADQICEAAEHAQSEHALADTARLPASEPGESKLEPRETVPLHPAAVAMRNFIPTTSDVVLADGHAGVAGTAALGPVVFVGGSYDVGDNFESAQGPLQGLYMHAASYTSLAMKTSEVHRLGVLAGDIVLGVILGFLFGKAWESYGDRTRTVQGHWQQVMTAKDPMFGINGKRKSLCRARTDAVFGLLANRIWLVATWVIPCALAAAAVYFAHWFLREGWWINPGPIILGMFLHAMSLRHTAAKGNEKHGHEHGAREHALEPHLSNQKREPGAFKELLIEHPGSVIAQLPLAAIFLAIAFWPR